MSDRGVFLTIDGPSGIGKSTTVAEVRRLLDERGIRAMQTAEPTTSGLGRFTRKNAEFLTGHALACLVAANRYEHITNEIEPALRAGDTVVCGRYLASLLVLQRLAGVPEDFLLAVNEEILLPDLAVILTADPPVIADRLAERGMTHRYNRDPAARAREIGLYSDAAAVLMDLHVRVLHVETTHATPSEVAAQIADAVPPPAGSVDCHTNPNDPPVTP